MARALNKVLDSRVSMKTRNTAPACRAPPAAPKKAKKVAPPPPPKVRMAAKKPKGKNPYSILIEGRGKGNRTQTADRTTIHILHRQGKNNCEIGRLLGIDRSNVSRILKHRRLDRIYTQRRATSLTEENLKIIHDIAEDHYKKKLPLTNAVWVALAKRAGWEKANERTLRDAKHKLDWVCVKAQCRPEHTFYLARRERRVFIAQERQTMTPDQWDRTIWIDESEGQIQPQREYVVKRGSPRPMVPLTDKKGEKVHFLIAIGNGWKSDLETLPLRRPVTRNEQGRAIVPTLATGRRRKGSGDNARLNQPNEGKTWNQSTLLPIFKKWVKTKAFQTCYAVVLDNAPSHHAIRDFLESKGIKVLDHPAGSPDMNAVEHVHQAIKQEAKRMHPAPINNHQYKEKLAIAFKNYTKEDFRAVVRKQRKINEEVIRVQGYPTKY